MSIFSCAPARADRGDEAISLTSKRRRSSRTSFSRITKSASMGIAITKWFTACAGSVFAGTSFTASLAEARSRPRNHRVPYDPDEEETTYGVLSALRCARLFDAVFRPPTWFICRRAFFRSGRIPEIEPPSPIENLCRGDGRFLALFPPKTLCVRMGGTDMRIMEIISCDCISGAVIHCLHLSRELVRRGHQVTMLCPPDAWIAAERRLTARSAHRSR